VQPETGEDPGYIEDPPDEVDPNGDPLDDDTTDDDPPPTTAPPTTAPPSPPAEGTPAELLTQAEELFEEAEQALRDGDLGEYQSLVR
jgi:hypothetical protein